MRPLAGTSLSLLFVAGAAAAAVDGSLDGPRAANSTSTSYLSQLADTWYRRGIEKDFDYATTVLYKGFELAIELSHNETLSGFYQDQMSIVEDDGTITGYNYSFYSLDEYRFGMSALYWYDRTGQEKYKLAADKIRAMLETHPRTASGGFWHRAPTYPNQMWLDGIFMADSFYARYTSLFESDNATAWDDLTLQYDLVEEHCGNATSQLLKHGYDESKVAVWADPVTGASPLVWDRADGWFFVSLLETIQVIPQSHEGHGKLVGYFESLAEGLLRAQDSSGGWWLVMDVQYAGAEGNYIESSMSFPFLSFPFLSFPSRSRSPKLGVTRAWDGTGGRGACCQQGGWSRALWEPPLLTKRNVKQAPRPCSHMGSSGASSLGCSTRPPISGPPRRPTR